MVGVDWGGWGLLGVVGGYWGWLHVLVKPILKGKVSKDKGSLNFLTSLLHGVRSRQRQNRKLCIVKRSLSLFNFER